MSKCQAFRPTWTVLDQKLKEMKFFHKNVNFFCKFILIFRPSYSLQKVSYNLRLFSEIKPLEKIIMYVKMAGF